MQLTILGKEHLKKCRIFFLWLVVLVCPSIVFAQLSDSLYNALPKDVRPKQNGVLSSDEKVLIVSSINIYYKPSFKAELGQIAMWLQSQAAITPDLDKKTEYLFATANYYMMLSNDSAILSYKKLIKYLEGKKGV